MADEIAARDELLLDELSQLTRAAFEDTMRQIAVADLTRGASGDRARFIQGQIDFYAWLNQTGGRIAELPFEDRKRLLSAGWSVDRVDCLEYTMGRLDWETGLNDPFLKLKPDERLRRSFYIEEGKVGPLLRKFGVKTNTYNLRIGMLAMVKGYLEAYDAAQNLSADPLASTSVLPVGLTGPMTLDLNGIAEPIPATAVNKEPQSEATASEVPPKPSSRTLKLFLSPSERATVDVPSAPDPVSGVGLLLSSAAERCIVEAQGPDGWSDNTCGQVRHAVRLLIFAIGRDPKIEELTQSDLGALVDLFGKLPNRYGRTREEVSGGLDASLKRAEALALQDKNLVGLGNASRKKHLTWLNSVILWAEGRGHKPAQPLNFSILRRGVGKKGEEKRQRARDKRSAWTTDEIAKLLSAPIWTGSADLFDRFTAGEQIWHDAWYWLPPMLVLYGGRSSELVGLPLADVFETAAIPYLKVDYTELRRVKNVQSVRHLPIHPELIRLGLLDYVAAMRKLGHKMLFPEMYSEKSGSFAATFYKSIFSEWRKWAFPDGTTWRQQVRGVIKDKDVHSFRGTASSLMKGRVPDSVREDILGHEGGSETSRTYDEEAPLDVKLEALKILSPLTSHLVQLPLRLRPAEFQCHGKPRGRRKQGIGVA